MEPREAERVLAEVADRREQTIEAGTAPWSGRAIATLCASVLALGLLTDADMIWLWAALMVTGLGGSIASGVRLRPTSASARWNLALVATFLLAFVMYVVFQFPARALDWPLPNTFGAVGAALTIALVSRPVQARLSASLRP